MNQTNNTPATSQQPQTLSVMLSTPAYIKRFEQILGSPKRAAAFTSAVLNVANGNDLLRTADPKSILNSAVVAATLNLQVNQNLGEAAIVPFYNSKTRSHEAQFQIMTRGLVQLCKRSGQFKTLRNEIVYEGELVKANRFTGEYEFDETCRSSDKVIGYMAYYKLVNGDEDIVYMTADDIRKHADKYSQTYKKGYGVWKDNFDAMALKTVLKRLLKNAPKSVEMEQAMVFDQAVVGGNLIEEDTIDNAEINYNDNKPRDLSELAQEAEIVEVNE